MGNSSRVLKNKQEWEASNIERVSETHPCDSWDITKCLCKGACSCHWKTIHGYQPNILLMSEKSAKAMGFDKIPELEPEDEDEVYTVQEFKELVENGALIDYDGYGYAVKNGKANPNIQIWPSEIEDIPEDATHIVWYNR